jgi:fatty acid-binding protein DegV
MAKIKFLTDSASDITEELEKKLDIQIMNFKVAMGDDSYTSRIDFDNEKFYKMLDDFDGIPVTSQLLNIRKLLRSSTARAILML